MKRPTISQKTPLILEVEAGTYWWCTCGKSQNQPYCDGAHKGTNFMPYKIDIKSKKRVAFCTCKHTRNQPYCDGAHSKL